MKWKEHVGEFSGPYECPYDKKFKSMSGICGHKKHVRFKDIKGQKKIIRFQNRSRYKDRK